MNLLTKTLLGASGCVALTAGNAFAQAAPPAPAPVPMPAMSGPLTNNPAPFSLDSVPGVDQILGKVYVSGALSGMVMGQSNAKEIPGDRDGYMDLTNGTVTLQKTDGWFQWYVQAGAYSYPTLGAPYTNASNTGSATFGAVPQAWGKVVLSASFNVIAGLQANYTMRAFNLSLSWNDGYYSSRYNEISGLVSYAFNGGADTLAVAAEWQMGHTFYGNARSTLFQQHSSIYNLIYTPTSGNWTISPYF